MWALVSERVGTGHMFSNRFKMQGLKEAGVSRQPNTELLSHLCLFKPRKLDQNPQKNNLCQSVRCHDVDIHNICCYSVVCTSFH